MHVIVIAKEVAVYVIGVKHFWLCTLVPLFQKFSSQKNLAWPTLGFIYQKNIKESIFL